MYVHECLRVTEVFAEGLHTAADAVHGASSANLWVICTSAGMGGFCLLHPTWGGGWGPPLPELLLSLEAWSPTLHFSWDLEE